MDVYIYADILFLINFSMDYLCLYISAKILHRAFTLKRLVLSSALGAVYSVVSLLLPLPSAVMFVIDIAVCLLMCIIVFHKKKQFPKTLITALVYFVVSMLLGGIMTALFNLLNRLDLPLGSVENDSLSVWGFAILAIGAGVISVFGGSIILKKNDIKTCDLRIKFGGKTQNFCALCDSGNLVKDAMSGRPVIIIDKEYAKDFVDESIINDFLRGIPSHDPSYSHMRITPINTVSGRSALVLLRAEQITVSYEKRGKKVSFSPNALFALGSVSRDDGYNAVVPQCIFGG